MEASEPASVCDRVLVMRDGVATAEVKRGELIEKLMVLENALSQTTAPTRAKATPSHV
jgi:ABC-type sugar transport system ATPase subunit